MTLRTLLLTPWFAPHTIISWQRAIVLVILGKAEVVDEYDDVVRSCTVTMRTPSVARLVRGSVSHRHVVRFSRLNVFTRDGFRCQYCGERKTMRELNYDHVLPRVRGGKTTWSNIVTSCYACNDRKGSRTPEEAGMKLLRKPFKPTSLPMAPSFRVERGDVPTAWQPFCPAVD